MSEGMEIFCSRKFGSESFDVSTAGSEPSREKFRYAPDDEDGPPEVLRRL